MSKQRPAAPAAAGAAASAPQASTAPAVHTYAPHPRDEFTGLGGSYLRDPVTGVRTRVPPEAPAAGTDTAAA